MHSITSLLLIIFVFTLSGCTGSTPEVEEALPKVVIQTTLGHIVVEVDVMNAPISAGNFLRYVDENRYRAASFFRTVKLENQPPEQVKIQVIQGGIGFVESELRLAPIAHETTRDTGILHKDGTISMARLGPGSATSDFFICIGDQPELDYGGSRHPDGLGFASFGRVTEGMDVVRQIHRQPDNGQILSSPVQITSIERAE